MRFLALTAFQTAWLALLTTALIVALYFLKHRRQRVVISSVMLWRRMIENQLENSIFEKLRRIVSIVVAVIIGLLVALAVARPDIESLTGRSRRIVVVLDTSPTMQARTSGGRTRWQHAVELAQDLVDEGAINTQFRIADTSGQFDSPFTAGRAELRKLIGRMHPVIAPTRFPDVDTDTYWITDGVSPLALPAAVTPLSVFEPAPNVGITAFEIRSMPSAKLAYEAYLEVTNFGKDARGVEISVSGAGRQRITRNVRLQSGESFKEALDLSQFEGGGIRAAVQSDGDALSSDDVAYAYLPVKRRAKTLLVTRGNALLETALGLHALVDLSVTGPSGYTAAGDFDAFVFDRFAPPDPPSRPALIVGAQAVRWLRQPAGRVANPRFESWMENHPVMRHVSLHDVTIDSAARINASSLSVLAAARGGTPLIVASERPRWILLTFDLQSSDFPHHAAFPLFIDNALAWFDRERLALRRATGIVDVPLAGAQVRAIDGRPMPSREHMGGTVFEAADPGLYVATQGDARQYVAVNFANRQYSDINSSHVREIKRAQAELPFLRRELWFFMLIAALLLVGAEWFTYHRRITL